MTDYFSKSTATSTWSEEKIFCEIGRALTSSLNPKEVFNRVMKLIGDYFSPRNWSLLLIDKHTGRLKFEIVMGVDATKLDQVCLEKEEGIAGWVCRHCQPAIVEDVSKDPRFSPRLDEILGFATCSVVSVPLLNGSNKAIGAIELINKIVPAADKADPESPPVLTGTKDVPFTTLDMEILSAIGAFTGIAAENAFLHQKVKDLAMIDPLTGVYNRLYFNEMLKREEKRIERIHYSICILMMDVDDLKMINDRYGHLTGDKVLRDIANILKSSIRESDVLARYGGDEFIVLMTNASDEDGKSLKNRINHLLDQWNQEKPKEHPALELSLGVYASGSEDLDNILQEADRELYHCKYFRKKHKELVSEKSIRSYLWDNFNSDEK